MFLPGLQSPLVRAPRPLEKTSELRCSRFAIFTGSGPPAPELAPSCNNVPVPPT
eukprot:CAMPEP_0206560754 /NCGR_PEP_ID=MMETSP0325_2-20121206/21198_1 /ASSEMBLY_ACC=CAM_ASM_000347 /TAXON_ID=2866 /ORGANISM="Crypthecodinium cohnii, Strain Seligo" /LENGTH=53 /DNA_ID=CAMNT_0054062547 /DNA_START=192 /DNA_END=349 /DNA_ORIENTATION=+